MILQSRAELCRYFGARHLGVLQRQFNADGRLVPIFMEAAGDRLLVATGPKREDEVLSILPFPLHVSDLLGQIELDQRTAEILARR